MNCRFLDLGIILSDNIVIAITILWEHILFVSDFYVGELNSSFNFLSFLSSATVKLIHENT